MPVLVIGGLLKDYVQESKEWSRRGLPLSCRFMQHAAWSHVSILLKILEAAPWEASG